jgi:hypothetical protein
VSASNDGGAAFPLPFGRDPGSDLNGMTLRDYFAAKAMGAVLGSAQFVTSASPEEVAKHAYAAADALLAERAKTKAVKFAPTPVAAKPTGLAFKCSLRIASVDVNKLPDPFVVKTANQQAIRATYVTGWRDGDPIPEVPGVVFEVERMPVSTGRAVF